MNRNRINTAAFCTTILMAVYFLGPALLSIDFLKPVKYYLQDFDISDMYYSNIKFDTPDTNIILINTGNLSPYNISRNIEAVLKQNPAVIGYLNNIDLDMISLDASKLRETIASDDRIVLSHPLAQDKDKQKQIIEKNIDIYKKSGFGNLLFGKNKEYFTIRTFGPFYELGDVIYQSFAYQVARSYNPKSASELIARNNDFERINFTGPQESFFNIEPVNFEADTYAVADYNISFDNKIVLMGEMRQLANNKHSSRFDDIYFTPVTKSSVWDFNVPVMHNIVIQANIISTIINGKYINKQPLFTEYILMALVAFFNCLFYIYLIEKTGGLNYLAGIIIMPLQTTLLVYFCFSLLESENFLFNINPALFAIPLSFFITEIIVRYIIPLYYKITDGGDSLTKKRFLRRKK